MDQRKFCSVTPTVVLTLLIYFIGLSEGIFNFNPIGSSSKQGTVFTPEKNADSCFCKLQGKIDDCSCNVDTVDHFNNVKLYPRLSSLVQKDYFRFFKVNLKRECPFWVDDSRCAMKFCHVQPCVEETIPAGLKGGTPSVSKKENMSYKYTKDAQSDLDECDHDKKLGYLNKTISESAYKDFARWKEYDDAQDNFCDMDDEHSLDTDYVDLLLNPERYTGYKGESAHRIWNSIYRENCFKPKRGFNPYIDSSNIDDLCLEKRVFYRAVSGLHTSINIHLSAKFLLSERNDFLAPEEGHWGANLDEFIQRFSPETTKGEGPQWLRNLYFLYLLELRALAKASPYLLSEEYFTGNQEEDTEVRQAVKDILKVARSFPDHFNESSMFLGGKVKEKLKEEFRLHFRNISRIMDCVGCDKCKLWGKCQIQGLGTALKILFSGHFDNVTPLETDVSNPEMAKFYLQRNEIVALFNALGRLSNSIYLLETFRNLLR